jgi:hypothetical protein
MARQACGDQCCDEAIGVVMRVERFLRLHLTLLNTISFIQSHTMKTKILLSLIFLFCLSFSSYSQIALPKQFNCVLSNDGWRWNYFTDGVYQFNADAWGNGVESPKELPGYLSDLYKRKLIFRKTKDGLWWGTGKYEGNYYYIVVIPQRLTTVTLKAMTNGVQFSNYSSWLLQQVRNNISSGSDFHLVNYQGKECTSN